MHQVNLKVRCKIQKQHKVPQKKKVSILGEFWCGSNYCVRAFKNTLGCFTKKKGKQFKMHIIPIKGMTQIKV